MVVHKFKHINVQICVSGFLFGIELKETKFRIMKKDFELAI